MKRFMRSNRPNLQPAITMHTQFKRPQGDAIITGLILKSAILLKAPVNRAVQGPCFPNASTDVKHWTVFIRCCLPASPAHNAGREALRRVSTLFYRLNERFQCPGIQIPVGFQ